MFFRNFLSKTLAAWRALTPMDRNNLVLNVPSRLINLFLFGVSVSAFLQYRPLLQAKVDRSSVGPDSPS
jgi:hypothetical protein